MNSADFSDERIANILAGQPMTQAERDFLLNDTPRFEECTHTRYELEKFNDAELMDVAYWVWVDYCR